MTTEKKLASVTAVVVLPNELPPIATFDALSQELAALAHDSEIVIIANGADAAVSFALRDLVERVPDATVHFLADKVDRDVAALIGMDRALGDWAVVLTPTTNEISALRHVVEETARYEIVFCATAGGAAPRGLYGWAGKLFFRVYGMLSGADMVWPTPRIRVYSRAATRYLISRLDGEFLMKSLTFHGAFPGTLMEAPNLDPEAPRQIGSAVRTALRSLLSASTVPLRLAVALACTGFVLGILALIYVVVMYLTLENVVRGWTTLSLLMSGMLVIFSGLFALLIMYMLAIYKSIQPRNRIPIVRELRSLHRRHADRLNVVEITTKLELGAPTPGFPDVRP